MNIIRWLILVCFVGIGQIMWAAAAAISAADSSVSFSLLSWNITKMADSGPGGLWSGVIAKDRLVSPDGEFILSLASPTKTKGKAVAKAAAVSPVPGHLYCTVLEAIKKFNADILCLQEVNAEANNILRPSLENLGYGFVYGHSKGNEGGVCLYCKRSKFNICALPVGKSLAYGIQLSSSPSSALSTSSDASSPKEKIIGSSSSYGSLGELDELLKGDSSFVRDRDPAVLRAGFEVLPRTDLLELDGDIEEDFTSAAEIPLEPDAATAGVALPTAKGGIGACAFALLEDRNTGLHVVVSSVHFVKKGKNDIEAQKYMLEQAKIMKQAVLDLFSCPIIFAGDFNYHQDAMEKNVLSVLNSHIVVSGDTSSGDDGSDFTSSDTASGDDRSEVSSGDDVGGAARSDDRLSQFKFFGRRALYPPYSPDFVVYRDLAVNHEQSCFGYMYKTSAKGTFCNNKAKDAQSVCENFPSDHEPVFVLFKMNHNDEGRSLWNYIKTKQEELNHYVERGIYTVDELFNAFSRLIKPQHVFGLQKEIYEEVTRHIGSAVVK